MKPLKSSNFIECSSAYSLFELAQFNSFYSKYTTAFLPHAQSLNLRFVTRIVKRSERLSYRVTHFVNNAEGTFSDFGDFLILFRHQIVNSEFRHLDSKFR